MPLHLDDEFRKSRGSWLVGEIEVAVQDRVNLDGKLQLVRSHFGAPSLSCMSSAYLTRTCRRKRTMLKSFSIGAFLRTLTRAFSKPQKTGFVTPYATGNPALRYYGNGNGKRRLKYTVSKRYIVPVKWTY